MELTSLVMAAQDWGPTAITTVMVFVIGHILKQQAKNTADDKAREKELKISLSNGLQRIEENLDKTILEMKASINDHGRRISSLEIDTIKKEDFYREMGGWRTELHRVSDLVKSQGAETTLKIIELWKEQK